jgi:hypothetical protein
MGADEAGLFWEFKGPPIVGGPPVNFIAKATLAQNGNTAFVFISNGNGNGSGGIIVPGAGGRVLELDWDALFSLWLYLPAALHNVLLTGCTGASTIAIAIPAGVPVGLTVYYAGFSLDGTGQVPSVTPTKFLVTQ